MSTDKQSGGLALVQQQLAARAASLKEQIEQPTANRLSINDNGDFVGADGLVLGPEVDLIVLDFISANRYYSRPYNPNNIEPPGCFAFGRVIADMAPHETAPEPQHEKCAGCPKNEYGTDARGTGKACKNTREIAVITHDQFDLPPEEQKVLVYSVPPSGLKSFDAAVNYVLRTHNMPPIAVVMRATAIKHSTYTTVSFQPSDETNTFIEAHYKRVAGGEFEDLLYRIPDVSQYGTKKPPVRAPRR